MDRLKKIAIEAHKGNKDAMEDLIMEAPSGVLDEMSAKEFAEKMATDDQFANDVYSRKEGTKYGSYMAEEYDMESEKHDAKKRQVMSIMAEFPITDEVAGSLTDAVMSSLKSKIGDSDSDNSTDDYEM